MDHLVIDPQVALLDDARRGAPIRLLGSSILRGCNVHHRTTVIRQEVDLGGQAGMLSGEAGADFAERFVERFGDLKRRVPGSDLTASLVERLNTANGAPLEQVLLEAILAVETSLAFERGDLDPIAFAKIEGGAPSPRACLIWASDRPKMSRGAAEIGLAGVLELLPRDLRRGGGPLSERDADRFEAALEVLQRYARRRRLAPTTAAVVLAAKQRGIPCEALGGPRLRLGQGALQHQILASVTANTSFAACRLSRDKLQTNRRLAELGLPVPRQIKVATVEDAEKAAEDLGYPIVIKPLKGKKGGAVAAGMTSRNDIPDAYQAASKAGSGVIVETLVDGDDHRLLVIGGRFIAAVKRTPPTIEGDGRRTIEQLIEALNDDPLRDDFRAMKVAIDEPLKRFLAKAGRTLGEVLAKGDALALRSTANVSTGGVAWDVTDQVHADNREMAIRAAATVGLDIAGIDFLTTDISRSHKEVGGRIIEINSRPGLRPHTWPRHGRPQDVAGAMFELLLPAGTHGRVPTLLVAGDRGTGPVARDLDAILRGTGKSVGLVTRKSTFLSGEPVAIEASRQRQAARILLRDPRVEALVGTVSLRQTVRRGLLLDGCDVAAIMDRAVDGDAELFRRGLDVLVRATRGKLVVGAGNAVALEAIKALDPSRLILVSTRRRDAVIERHRAAGGAAVVRLWRSEQNQIVLHDGNQEIAAIAVDPPPTGAGGRTRARLTEARMFAVALVYGMGLSGPEIEAAVRAAPAPVTRPANG